MEQTLVERKLFFAWQDHKEEAYLRDMANRGWHFKRAGFLRFEFEKGEPADIVYRLDYKNTSDQDMAEYIEIFNHSGWEYAGRYAGWQYFRKPAMGGIKDEIFSDNESKIAKYNRIILLLVVINPAIYTAIWIQFLDRLPKVVGVIFGLLFTSATLLYAVAIIKLIQRINELKK